MIFHHRLVQHNFCLFFSFFCPFFCLFFVFFVLVLLFYCPVLLNYASWKTSHKKITNLNTNTISNIISHHAMWVINNYINLNFLFYFSFYVFNFLFFEKRNTLCVFFGILEKKLKIKKKHKKENKKIANLWHIENVKHRK